MPHRIILAALVALPVAAAGQPCNPEWSSGFRFNGLESAAAMTTWRPQGPDQPRLVAMGQFAEAGISVGDRVGIWTGSAWEFLGGAFDSHELHALASFDEDGPGPGPAHLYAGGWYQHIEGQPVTDIARWDDDHWSQVGSGLPDGVFALCTYDSDGEGASPPVLVAGGGFKQFGDEKLSAVAAWDGVSWSRLGVGCNAPVRALLAWDDDGDGRPALYVGGDFAVAGGQSAYRIARWDGSAWHAVGGGLTKEQWPNIQSVHSFATYDDDGPGPVPASLFVGGTFRGAGGVRSPSCIRWDGQQWSPVGVTLAADETSPRTAVNSMIEFDFDGRGPGGPVLCAGGILATSCEGPDGLALWDGIEWTLPSRGVHVGHEPFSFGVNALVPWNHEGPRLLVGGDFAWQAVVLDERGAHPLGADPCCEMFFNELCYSVGVSAAAAWDDDGPGPRPEALYVAGSFSSLRDAPETSGIARLDDTGWSSLGFGESWVADVLPFDADGPGPASPVLVVTGDFDSAGGAPASKIAAWDGQSWSAFSTGLGGMFSTEGHALASFDPDGEGPGQPGLIVGGQFLTAGDKPVAHVAMWDGAMWLPLADGLGAGENSEVNALCVFDPDADGPEAPLLIAGGSFAFSGDTPLSNIGAWDGQSWHPLGAGIVGTVWALVVHDEDGDGPGLPALFAGGYITSAGGQPANHIARWDGHAWTPLGSGIDGKYWPVQSLASFDEDAEGPMPPALYVGGNFHAAGGVPSDLIARWGCPAPTPCPADCDSSGALDVADWLCFLAKFNAADPAADCDNSGGLDLFDFLCFINAFNAGC